MFALSSPLLNDSAVAMEFWWQRQGHVNQGEIGVKNVWFCFFPDPRLL